ncbi:hypothetical protein NS228_14335 [Methylobacterium indicum]|uniref:hypothetical protein n=1 Tax=Methylobacterium indicum TaxID=1775910 RepID=UPI00073423C8|nr:hypothetical protein [Methylobacterium indicum]KTS31508.1 hypothetical protein NS229_13735 [Methylobacterium indicum]KTS39718.1 hypothetical protein NS228_14335 [Methylobacterium indicum]KTS53375.1 hypothetical protein NS230_06230 [Methylobacterium indicum]
MRHAPALILLAGPLFLGPLFVGPLTGTALAQGTPRSVGECERIKGDLAYNQCLSLFGPAAKNVAAAAAAVSAAIPRLPLPPALAEAAAGAEPAPRGRRGWNRRLRGGRQSATFAVISGGGSRHYRRRRHR